MLTKISDRKLETGAAQTGKITAYFNKEVTVNIRNILGVNKHIMNPTKVIGFLKNINMKRACL